MRIKLLLLIILLVLSTACGPSFFQREMDSFESIGLWKTIVSDSTVYIQTSTVPGKTGNALRIDYEFSSGTGYCGIQKEIHLNLPENFQFCFYLKANSPANNLEFKLLDKSGENVWWRNQRNFEFPQKWTKIVIRKRDIEFAWGPAQDKTLHSVDKIQFFIASARGGKGTIYLDDFRLESLTVQDTIPPEPIASASSAQKGFPARHLFDGNLNTVWKNQTNDQQPEIIIDLQKQYEYGGLVIDWDNQNFARKYDVLAGNNKKDWEIVYRVKTGHGGRAYLPLKNGASRYIKLQLKETTPDNRFVIKEVTIKNFGFSEMPEAVYREMAKDNLRGCFPRYFSNEQSYWTVSGVNSDSDEALINEDGMVEVNKGCFSIEPFLCTKKGLLTWNDVHKTASLPEGYLPIPALTWRKDSLQLQTQIFSDGPAGESILYLQYKLSNFGTNPTSGNLYLAVRPFQVNPPWQNLNWPGGTARIESMTFRDNRIQVNDTKTIYTLSRPDAFGTVVFDQGDISEYLEQDSLPPQFQIKDRKGLASGALRYAYQLNSGQQKTVSLAVPFHQSAQYLVEEAQVEGRLRAVGNLWREKLNRVKFRLPKSADLLINTLRSNLAYILINRDGSGIQPGSRSYERSWIRDGSLTSSALLKMGVQQEVKDFINWYSAYQYADGKVPCVIDSRGPDPTPENDSHGQLIFAILQYFNFTGDKTFLRAHYSNVQKAIAYMDALRASRKTEIYRTGTSTEQACYGLLPESISHEGYSAKPMHSYWDDFFALKGYKDAVRIAEILGKKEDAAVFAAAGDSFKSDLYRSIRQAVLNKHINFIPGCVELGDFDATSTAITVYPCGELKNLPQPYAQNTFDRYYKYFQDRRAGKIDWRDYTPYEVRLIGTFIYLGQIERAIALIDYFFKDQRPKGWNHWAEVVRKGYRTSGFIGDMPHTWVGSDFINATRSMFVYEDELKQALVIGAGLYKEWIDDPKGITVKNLPTYYGDLSYSIKKSGEKYNIDLWGTIKLPPGKIIIRNPWGKKPKMVFVNGIRSNTFDKGKILIDQFPASIRVIL